MKIKTLLKNDFFKKYIRILKENKIPYYKNFNLYFCYPRYYSYHDIMNTVHNIKVKKNSLFWNIDIPDMFITEDIKYEKVLELQMQYQKLVIPYIIKEFIRIYKNEKKVKLTKKQTNDIIINAIKKYENKYNKYEFIHCKEHFNIFKAIAKNITNDNNIKLLDIKNILTNKTITKIKG